MKWKQDLLHLWRLAIFPLMQFAAISVLMILFLRWQHDKLSSWAMMAFGLAFGCIPMAIYWLLQRTGLIRRRSPSLIDLDFEKPRGSEAVSRTPALVMLTLVGIFAVLSVAISIYVLLKRPDLGDITIYGRDKLPRQESKWLYLFNLPVIIAVAFGAMAWAVLFKWKEFLVDLDRKQPVAWSQKIDTPALVYSTYGIFVLMMAALFSTHVNRSLELLFSAS